MGNTTNKCSNAFKLDNQAPGVTASVSDKTISYTLTDNVALSGYAITTSTSTPTSWTAASGTSKTGTATKDPGTYYVHVKDSSGNTNVSSELVINEVEVVYTFDYTGDIEEFTIERSGIYKLEVYGSQGNDNPNSGGGYYGATGGKGGYSYGQIELTEGDVLYIGVGGKNGYNGGGGYAAGGTVGWGGANGGGATHIALNNNLGILKKYKNNKDDILIVAGGGGGAGATTKGANICNGGSGGGTKGGTGGYYQSTQPRGAGGTQNAGGKGVEPENDWADYYGKGGSFGQGGVNEYVITGGGGGWFGGGSGAYYNGGSGGGGGSGYLNTNKLISETTGMDNGKRTGNGQAIITYIGP